MKTIINREQIVDELAEILKDLDKACRKYQTDIYLYMDKDGNATLDTFVNVGGNSWLDDDHYTIYSDREHLDAYNGFYNSWDIESYADLIGKSADQLIAETAEFCDDCPVEDINGYDVDYYMIVSNRYNEELDLCYSEAVDEMIGVYIEQAEQIISDFENE